MRRDRPRANARHEKDVPFEAAPFGVTGLETAFSGALHTSRRARLAGARDLLERMSTGPARAYGLRGSSRRGRRSGEPRALDPDASWRVTEDGFRSARRTPGCSARPSMAASAPRSPPAGWRTRDEGGGPGARGRHGLPRPVRRGRRGRVRRGCLHDRDDRLPGGRDGSQLRGQVVCFTAPMVGNYGVARWRSEPVRTHAQAVVVREARPEWTDWLNTHGLVALSGIDTRSPLAPAPGRAPCGPLQSPARLRSTPCSKTCAPSLRWPAARSPPRSPRPSRSSSPIPARPHRRRRLRLQGSRSWNRLAWKGAAVTVYRTTPTPTSSPAMTGCCSRTAPATPSRSKLR